MQDVSHDAVIHQITYLPKKRTSLFQDIEASQQGMLLLKLSLRIQKDILNNLQDDEIVALANYVDPDKATDILQKIDTTRAKRITAKLNENIRDKTEFLLKFHPKTAAGMMKIDYILVERKITFGQLGESLKKHEKRTGKFPVILVVEMGELLGELPGHTLALHDSNETIDKYIKKVPSLRYDSDERSVIDLFIKHPHNKVVVLDNDKSVLGIIHSDEVLQIIDKGKERSLYDFAGVSREEDALDSALTKVKYRYVWLIINLATAFLAASVVSLFEDTISKFVLLAVYMPIVAGMGGNAGTQAMAVAVRGLVMKEIELNTGKTFIINEMIAGAVNGIINGIIVAIIATFLNGSPELGLVLGLAMVVNLIIAGFFGALIPMVMKSLGKDPASSATIFITTATDVFGFFVFLSLAKLIL